MLEYDTRRFGYYRVGSVEVFSKIEALELSNRLNQPITWHYNDEVFNSYNWKQEPASSLEELYQERARQIREKYDHVVLLYSSGADSHNMLESFLQAGIHIDEIASFHCYSADNDRNSVFNNEVFNSAIPHIQRLRDQHRLSDSVKFRLIDIGDMVHNFCNKIDWFDYPYMINSVVSVNNVARSELRNYVTEWADIISQGKKLVLVWGHDKPRLMNDDQGFFINFLDIYDNCVSTKIQQTCPAGWYDEIFYSTPDLPLMIIKQAHVIKNFLTTCPQSHPFLTKTVTGLGQVIKRDNTGAPEYYWLHQEAQDMLIYPWFDSSLYMGEKPKDVLYSLRDTWFWKDPVLSKNYQSMVNGLLTKFKDQWINVGATTRSTKNYRSCRYYLG